MVQTPFHLIGFLHSNNIEKRKEELIMSGASSYGYSNGFTLLVVLFVLLVIVGNNYPMGHGY